MYPGTYARTDPNHVAVFQVGARDAAGQREGPGPAPGQLQQAPALIGAGPASLTVGVRPQSQ